MAKSKTAEGPRPNRGYGDLRDLIALLEERGELMRIDGADWNLEIGTLQELIFAEMGREQGAPAMLFENIPGSPPGFRALTGTMSTTSRVATILGLPEDGGAIEVVEAYRDRMRTDFELTPPEVVDTGAIFQNIERDDEVDLTKFPAPFLHEDDGGRYIGTDDLVILRDLNNLAVLDACRPWGWKDDFPKVAEASPELKAKMRQKWSHLFDRQQGETRS